VGCAEFLFLLRKYENFRTLQVFLKKITRARGGLNGPRMALLACFDAFGVLSLKWIYFTVRRLRCSARLVPAEFCEGLPPRRLVTGKAAGTDQTVG
jgi:hypothetical protein